jgi:hypothetical protein
MSKYKKDLLPVAAQYQRQQGINPIFYLIIYLKLVGKNAKNVSLMFHFAQALQAQEDFCTS